MEIALSCCLTNAAGNGYFEASLCAPYVMNLKDPCLKLILLVDDDPDDRELFADALSLVGEGLSLKTVENGIEALELLDQANEKPGLIFLDLNMPLMNGHDCLRGIKANEQTRHIPVIIFSTSILEETVDAVYRSGASLYVVKPNSFAALKELQQKILALNWENLPHVSKENFILKL